jgi:hypothetical protein
MTLRRLVALLVLALDAVVVFGVAPSLGMLEIAAYAVGAVVGIGALGVLVFNLPSRRSGTEFDNSGYEHHNPFHRAVGGAGILFFAIGPLFIAARGAYRGVAPSLLPGPDIAFSQAPGRFTLNLLAFVVWGLAFLFVFVKVVRAKTGPPENAAGSPHDRDPSETTTP